MGYYKENFKCNMPHTIAPCYIIFAVTGSMDLLSMETCYVGSFLDDHKEEGMFKITLPHMMVFIIMMFVLWPQGLMTKVSGIPPFLKTLIARKR